MASATEESSVMSYSTHRRDSLDPALPLPHRASHARSLAMLMGEKYRVPRATILELVQKACGIDLTAPVTNEGWPPPCECWTASRRPASARRVIPTPNEALQ